MHLEKMVDTLVQANFYDMAFTVLFKFWQGSALKRHVLRYENFTRYCPLKVY